MLLAAASFSIGVFARLVNCYQEPRTRVTPTVRLNSRDSLLTISTEGSHRSKSLAMPLTRVQPLFLAFLVAACLGNGFAQSNSTAGLAGLGAGAALGASAGQGGTTPSSASPGGGGGSSPIEEQMMAFRGMQQIAKEIAETVSKTGKGCTPSVEENERFQGLRKDLDRSKHDSQANSADLGKDVDQLVKDLQDIDASATDTCAILIEDPTSANQIALYQAVQGYSDHLERFHYSLERYFSLLMPATVALKPIVAGQTSKVKIRLTNTNETVLSVTVNTHIRVSGKYVEKNTGNEFPTDKLVVLDTTDCSKELKMNESCDIEITFPNPKEKVPAPGQLTAKLDVPIGDTGASQTVLLTGEVKPAVITDFESNAKMEKYKQDLKKGPLDFNPDLFADLQSSDLAPLTSEATTTPTTPPSTPTGAPPTAAAASTPVGLTYLQDISTALAGFKASYTYSPSAFQPTVQAFEILVEAELARLDPPIMSYTSTSALNLRSATDYLSNDFGKMLAWGNDISTWTNLCKPPSANGTQNSSGPQSQNGAAQNSAVQSGTPANSACTMPGVVVNLSVAQQMLTGYTTLLSTANDGSGNPVIVDILRGAVLSHKMGSGIPSLQVSVAAAGGSSKTNSPFFVNLFYQFAPSYNAGVIVAFELRNGSNDLVASGVRNAYFNYKHSWAPGPFNPNELKKEKTCGAFCSVGAK
jgi:hypothetical protein